MKIFVRTVQNSMHHTLPFVIGYRPRFFNAGDTYPGFDMFYKNWIHNHLRVLKYVCPYYIIRYFDA